MNHRQIKGVFMLVIAGILFLMPAEMKKPGVAHHQMLVANDVMKDGLFEKTVIVVVQHNGFGAFGFIVNRPGNGGPVSSDDYFVLTRGDMTSDTASPEQATRLVLKEGETITSAIRRVHMRDQDAIVVKGYSGWGILQLNREIHRGSWRVVAYDPELVFKTPAYKMWARAIRKAELVN